MEATLRLELSEVDAALSSIEEQVETLLQQQCEYQERRKLLILQLDSIARTTPSGKEGALPLTSSSSSSSASLPLTTDWENASFPWSERASALLKSRFNMDSFRPLQRSCINATLSGKDVILIMPTGGGKSLCYQLPTLLSSSSSSDDDRGGLTLVVSPLVSLMEDQLLAAKALGIPAAMLSASTPREVVNAVHADMVDPRGGRGGGGGEEGSLRLLYVTPEKVAKNKRFMSKLEKCYSLGRLSRMVIDEVHCASQWGHDFRPDYKALGILKRQFPNAPLLGLTATATSKVLEDCREMLSLTGEEGGGCLVFRASYNRPNLFYEVRAKPPAAGEQVAAIADLIKSKFSTQSGIVYCLSRKDTEQVSSQLCEQGVRAACYHADMAAEERTSVHMGWLKNKLQVIVATVAFGMGIDKPNVRFVIHHTLSKSMENYYQESGRAGRDGSPAHCITFYRSADAFRQSAMVMTERTGLQNLYAHLRYCLNQTDCRRALIARSFGEQWRPSDCTRGCDICSLSSSLPSSSSSSSLASPSPVRHLEDVSEHCKALLSCLEKASSKEQRVTPLKLLELWRGKGGGGGGGGGRKGGDGGGGRGGGSVATLSQEWCERVLVYAIMEEVLKEEFHFTPYSTISYIGPGRKAEWVKAGTYKLKISSSGATSNCSESSTPEDDKLEVVEGAPSVAGGKPPGMRGGKRRVEGSPTHPGGPAMKDGIADHSKGHSLLGRKRKRDAPEVINLDD